MTRRFGSRPKASFGKIEKGEARNCTTISDSFFGRRLPVRT